MMIELPQWHFQNGHFSLVFILLFLVWLGKFFSYWQYIQKKRNSRPLAYLLPSPRYRLLTVKMVLLLIAYIFLTLALMRPQILYREYPQLYKGRDIIFLLDVSRSMLAKDVPPNRLENARFIIKDILSVLQSDRASLVAFAGSTAILTPYTYDYHFLEMVVDDVSPYHVSRGGTLIGDALRFTRENLIKRDDAPYTDIILISDGEDHGSFPGEAAHTLGQKGVRIISVGIGTPQGSTIPSPEGRDIMYHKGEPVISRLEEATLEEVASLTPGGEYLPWHHGVTNFHQFYRELRQNVPERQSEELARQHWKDIFYPFIIIGLVFLLLSFRIHPFSSKQEGES